MSCKVQEKALEEILEHSKDYETNYNLLDECGMMGAKPETEYEKGLTIRDIQKGNRPENKLVRGEVKLTMSSMTYEDMEESLNNDLRKAKQMTGLEPETRMIAMARDGSGIHAFVVGEQTASVFGIMIGYIA